MEFQNPRALARTALSLLWFPAYSLPFPRGAPRLTGRNVRSRTRRALAPCASTRLAPVCSEKPRRRRSTGASAPRRSRRTRRETPQPSEARASLLALQPAGQPKAHGRTYEKCERQRPHPSHGWKNRFGISAHTAHGAFRSFRQSAATARASRAAPIKPSIRQAVSPIKSATFKAPSQRARAACAPL